MLATAAWPSAGKVATWAGGGGGLRVGLRRPGPQQNPRAALSREKVGPCGPTGRKAAAGSRGGSCSSGKPSHQELRAPICPISERAEKKTG